MATRIPINRFEAIVFDMDGVILDSMAAHAETWRQAFSEFGLDVETDFLLQHEGALDADMLVEVFARRGQILEIESFNPIYRRQRELYSREYAHQVSVYPQAVQLVERLAAGSIPMALVTSSKKELIPAKYILFRIS